MSTTTRFWRSAAVAFAVLVALRVAAPVAIQWWVNRTLTANGGQGSIGNVDLNLWRGAYEIENLWLASPGARADESATPNTPLLDVRRVDLSIDWGALAYGRIVAEIELHQPVLNWMAGRGDASAPPEIDESGSTSSDVGDLASEETATWADRIDALVPFSVDRLVVRDGEVRFRDFSTDPAVDAYISDLYVEVLDLSNVRDEEGEPRWAELEAAGRPFGTGELELRIRLDLLGAQPTFELDAAIRKVQATDLNDALAAYADVDAEAGTLSIFAEFAAHDGQFEGYVKPVFDDLELVRWNEFSHPAEALSAFRDALVGLGTEIFENQVKGRLATKIPMEGEFGTADIDVWSAVGSLLHNSFVQALLPAIDSSVDIGDLPGSVPTVKD